MKTTENTMKIIVEGLTREMIEQELGEKAYCPVLLQVAQDAADNLEMCIDRGCIEHEKGLAYVGMLDSLCFEGGAETAFDMLRDVFFAAGCRDIVTEMDLVRVCGEVESDAFDDFMEIFLDSDEVDMYLTEIDLREAARAEKARAARGDQLPS